MINLSWSIILPGPSVLVILRQSEQIAYSMMESSFGSMVISNVPTILFSESASRSHWKQDFCNLTPY